MLRREENGRDKSCEKLRCHVGHVRPERRSFGSHTLWRLECAMAVSSPHPPAPVPALFPAAARKMDNRPPFSPPPSPPPLLFLAALHLCPQIMELDQIFLWEMTGRQDRGNVYLWE